MNEMPPEAAPTLAGRWVRAMLQRRAPIALFLAVVAVVSVVVALILKPWYRAEATILPPTEGGDVFSNLAGLIESSALNRVGLFSTSTPSDVYVEILKSRRVRESLVEEFGLEELYDRKGMDRTLKELARHLRVSTNSAGLISVQVEDHDRNRAADMANFLVNELDRFNRETLNTRGKRTRQFLESRLADAQERLFAAESTMTAYEQRHKVVLAGEESAVRGIADVMAQKLSLQVKRAYVSSYSAPGSPKVREIDAEIEAFNRELGRLPTVKNEGARLVLDAQIQRKVFTLLTAQYEEARVQEMRDTPTVTVLDVARPPDLRARPRRTIIVVGSVLAAFAIASGWVAISLGRGTAA